MEWASCPAKICVLAHIHKKEDSYQKGCEHCFTCCDGESEYADWAWYEDERTDLTVYEYMSSDTVCETLPDRFYPPEERDHGDLIQRRGMDPLPLLKIPYKRRAYRVTLL